MITMMIFPYTSWFSSVKQRHTRRTKFWTINRKKMKNLISKQMKQLLEKNKKTNQVAMGIIQVCVHYDSTMLPLRFCYVLIMFLLCFYYVYHMLLICFCYASVMIMICSNMLPLCF